MLNNGEIVTEKPSSEIDRLCDNVEVTPSQHETTSHCATIRARVTVASSRLIVVDENDRIIEIWSNTNGANGGFCSLRIKEQRVEGLEHPLTPEILAQYNRLLGRWIGIKETRFTVEHRVAILSLSYFGDTDL